MLLEYYKNLFETINLEEYEIIVVSNVKGKTRKLDDYLDNFTSAKFMIITSFERLVNNFRSIGLETTAYFNKNRFISEFISENLYQSRQKKQLSIIHRKMV